ncbi:Cytochrome c551 peroxidase [Roseibacterium elongatum DSM 19469]|uniref:Cytochrome c551 peroxidase n=1 Tax=Roseicyclus elongatus DSM 19469 TaxID=1294273 RepID=W8RW05_9RHOB|nr:cytochrome-c peroxidase [Roseibacterium elongatum]AHM05458.1 Cytochrome c551 peroxidase [Roseibacterium elongatum DSM 19469]
MEIQIMFRTTLTAAVALATAIAGPALANDELREYANELFEPIPLSTPDLDGNMVTRQRVDLGAMLFFDPRMSRSGLFSCQSCHNVGTGGVDGLETSIGHGWQAGPRNSPTVFNAVFNIAQFWDGRAADLAEQAVGPVQAGVEMNNTPERVIDTLNSMQAYVDAFAEAFPGEDDPVTFDNFALAIEAFEATLTTPNSRFDQFLMGADTLDEQELAGLEAFIDQGCAACHAGVNMGGQDYYPFGLVERPGADVLPEGDRGRFAVTETAMDDYVFRAAPLRNIELTAPYFHSGVVWELEEAVAVMGVAQLGADLSEQEISDIAAFLRTLTGEIPEVVHPVLPPRTADTPLPEPM